MAVNSIDEYIKGFPEAVQEVLQKIRETVRQAAPEVEETISYGMPTFNLNGKYLVYFAAFKKHIGFYPAPVHSPELRDELAPYAAGQGTAKFPLNKPIPYDLITKIVKFRKAATP